MQEKKKAPNNYKLFLKFWEKIKKTNPFVRGFFGAFALLAIFENVIPFERYEILRAIFAIVVSWNEMMKFLGEWIGLIPFIPIIPTWFLNGLTIYSLLFLGNLGYKPALVFTSNKFPNKKYIFIFFIIFVVANVFITSSLTPLSAFILIFSLLTLLEDHCEGNLKKLIILSWWFLLISLMAFVLFYPEFLGNAWMNLAAYGLVIIFICISVFASRPLLRKGVITSVGALVMVSILYALHLPVVKTLVNQKAEEVLCKKGFTTDCNKMQ